MENQDAAKHLVENNDINWITTSFMAAFHIGAVAAIFFFTWKALFFAIALWWVSGSLGIGMGYRSLASPIAAIQLPNGSSIF